MPNIVIKEIDETSAGTNVASTDVAYVPGFADTNFGVYIYDTFGAKPVETTAGTVAEEKSTYNSHTQYPCFACNIAEKKTWKCIAASEGVYTWEVQDVYVEPYPENVPVLCTTLAEFEANFGNAPYEWVKGSFTASGAVEDTAGFDARRTYPAFAEGALATQYAYEEKDFEKSYIYAKELIAMGIPVLFENVVARSSFNRKELPSVNYLYQQLVKCYSELDDKGEYSVKYITSGAYPTYEYEGTATYTGEFSDNGEFPFSSESATEDVPTKNCAGDYYGAPIGGPQNLAITANAYIWAEDLVYSAEGTELPGEGVTPVTEGIVPTAGAHYYNSDDQKSWTATSVTQTINVTPNSPYVESGENGWGGVGNVITVTDLGFTVSYNNGTPWNWISASYVATATKTVDVSGVGADIVSAMIATAQKRGDAVALIDHANNPARPLIGNGSIYQKIVTSNGFTDGEFGAMFTPWAAYSVVREDPDVPSPQLMPASFGYLLSLGKSLRTNANWLAVAGVARGMVPYIQSLNTIQRLSNTIADTYQPRDNTAINPITNIKPYGLTIWGNRTLKKNVGNITATSMLNIRNLVSDVKKIAYTTAKSLMFEQNSDVLWVNFKAGITPLLDQMLSGQGLSGYKIIKGTTTEKAKVVANIRLYPLYAVESFEITVVISDEEVSVS